MNLHLQFSMADHIKFQDFPGLEIKILTLQTVWLTGAEVGPLTRLLWLPLASCCEALTSHPIINEFIHSKQWSHMYWSNDPRTCWAIEAIVSSVHQVSSPGFEAMKSRWSHLKNFRCIYETIASIVQQVRGSFLQFISKAHFRNTSLNDYALTTSCFGSIPKAGTQTTPYRTSFETVKSITDESHLRALLINMPWIIFHMSVLKLDLCGTARLHCSKRKRCNVIPSQCTQQWFWQML